VEMEKRKKNMVLVRVGHEKEKNKRLGVCCFVWYKMEVLVSKSWCISTSFTSCLMFNSQ
jgi:hypothetical protein